MLLPLTQYVTWRSGIIFPAGVNGLSRYEAIQHVQNFQDIVLISYDLSTRNNRPFQNYNDTIELHFDVNIGKPNVPIS